MPRQQQTKYNGEPSPYTTEWCHAWQRMVRVYTPSPEDAERAAAYKRMAAHREKRKGKRS